MPLVRGEVIDAVAGDNGVFVKSSTGILLYQPGIPNAVYTSDNSNTGEGYLLPNGDGILYFKNGYFIYRDGPGPKDETKIRLKTYNHEAYSTINHISFSTDCSIVVFSVNEPNTKTLEGIRASLKASSVDVPIYQSFKLDLDKGEMKPLVMEGSGSFNPQSSTTKSLQTFI
ncbi:hypothetical protein [Chitinophaga filiformis]|uniref:hypothetical protein n=1 Tax=Chitinophaga filiformis TaxID=104663 RepID=UPI00115F971D|nr:hypothetical protein [Chitinophaga filiformis]